MQYVGSFKITFTRKALSRQNNFVLMERATPKNKTQPLNLKHLASEMNSTVTAICTVQNVLLLVN